MLSSIRPRTLARSLGLSVPSGSSRRTFVLISSSQLNSRTTGSLSSSPSLRRSFASLSLLNLPSQPRQVFSGSSREYATPSPPAKPPPPFVKPAPFDPSVHKGPPLPSRPIVASLPDSRPRQFSGYSHRYDNVNRRQYYAIKGAKERSAMIARGEDPRSERQKRAAGSAYSANMAKFLKESHDAFNTNQTVTESLDHLGLASLSDRVPNLEVTLMPHQVIGVSWMVKQEQKEDYKGGILADDMGLGKTIQMLALMVINKPQDPSKRMTLIVVPNALMEQWKQEIETKSTPDLFKVLIHHGTGRTKSLETLQQYDVVITTYGTVRSDLAEPHLPLSLNHWHRVVLDEAHYIRTNETAISLAVLQIKSDYRWTLTGTPVMNSLKDLYPQFRFLQIPNFSDPSQFTNLIANPGLDQQTAGERLQAVMKTIMFRRTKESRLDGKLIVDLMPKTELTEKLEFSESEREIYSALLGRAQVSFNEYMAPASELKTAGPQNLVVQLLRLRQATSHPSLVTSALEVDDATEAYEEEYLQKEMEHAAKCHGSGWVEQTVAEFKTLDLGPDGRACAVCSNPLSEPMVTSCCRELICASCLDDLPTRVATEQTDDDEESEQPYCPTCNHDLEVDDLFKAAAFLDKVPSSTFSDSPKELPRGIVLPSTKMLRMNELVNEWLLEDPTAKIIIFSQWTASIDLISKYLEQEGHSSLKFTGGMSQPKRTEALNTFTFETDPKILLMNVKAGGVGLNIVRANKIIFMDLSWSPFVEAQAMARAHRIGQVKPVDVRRLVIQDSVEEVMLAIQRRKMNASDLSLGEGGQRMEPLSGSDLAELFGIRISKPDRVVKARKKDEFKVDVL